jgi:hypothetical protein
MRDALKLTIPLVWIIIFKTITLVATVLFCFSWQRI